VERYGLGCMYKVKFFESTNAKVFKNDPYLFGTTNRLSITSCDQDGRFVIVNEELTEDAARELSGKLVRAGGVPMCVERVDAAARKIIFRWMISGGVVGSILPLGGGADDVAVYGTVIYGQNAYGNIELGMGGENVKIIINPPGSSGAADPLEQRGTIAWKVKGFTCVILQDAFIVRVEHGASA